MDNQEITTTTAKKEQELQEKKQYRKNCITFIVVFAITYFIIIMCLAILAFYSMS